MPAFKKVEGRFVYLDLTDIHVPSWKIRDVQKAAHAKLRALKKICPFAKVVGAKRAYESAEDLKAACDSYFEAQECHVFDKWGKPLVDPETGEYLKTTKPLTLSGLALHLGISTDTLRKYKKKALTGLVSPEFSAVIFEALQRIEEYAEGRIYDKDGQRGSQFVLQAGFGWQTRKEASESARTRVEVEIAKERLRMQQQEHQLKMKLLEAGVDDEADNEVKITITRASRKEED